MNFFLSTHNKGHLHQDSVTLKGSKEQQSKSSRLTLNNLPTQNNMSSKNIEKKQHWTQTLTQRTQSTWRNQYYENHYIDPDKEIHTSANNNNAYNYSNNNINSNNKISNSYSIHKNVGLQFKKSRSIGPNNLNTENSPDKLKNTFQTAHYNHNSSSNLNFNNTQNSLFLTNEKPNEICRYLDYLQDQDIKFPKDKVKFLRVKPKKIENHNTQKLRRKLHTLRSKPTLDDKTFFDILRKDNLKKNLSKIQEMESESIIQQVRQELQQLIFTIQKCMDEFSDQQGTQLIAILNKFNKKLYFKLFLTDDHKHLKRLGENTIDKCINIIQKELFLNSQGSHSLIEYKTTNINKLYQLIIFDIGYLQEKIQAYISLKFNQKLEIIQHNIIEENMDIINIRKDIVRNKPRLIKQHPEIKLDQIGKEVKNTRYRLEDRLRRLELNSGQFKKLHKITRVIENQVDQFSGDIQNNQLTRLHKDYFFNPISLSQK